MCCRAIRTRRIKPLPRFQVPENAKGRAPGAAFERSNRHAISDRGRRDRRDRRDRGVCSSGTSSSSAAMSLPSSSRVIGLSVGLRLLGDEVDDLVLVDRGAERRRAPAGSCGSSRRPAVPGPGSGAPRRSAPAVCSSSVTSTLLALPISATTSPRRTRRSAILRYCSLRVFLGRALVLEGAAVVLDLVLDAVPDGVELGVDQLLRHVELVALVERVEDLALDVPGGSSRRAPSAICAFTASRSAATFSRPSVLAKSSLSSPALGPSTWRIVDLELGLLAREVRPARSRLGKVTSIVRVSPFFMPTSCSSKPGMNSPEPTVRCAWSDEPPAKASPSIVPLNERPSRSPFSTTPSSPLSS